MDQPHGNSRVATLDERGVLTSDVFLTDLEQLAADTNTPLDELRDYAKRCLAELAVRPQERYLHWSARLARFMVTRSYDADIDVNADALERLKSIGRSQPLVFLWSHKSHLDSFVFLRALYEADFRPQPLSFAGINMNFAMFGKLARNAGAIFLRRSFRDDAVYRLVLQHYIDYLVHQRVHLSWSIEGTRSRTGKLMPPKLGLIQWVLDAYRRASCDDALLVPVAISFDQIPEIDDYVAMQRGLPKRRESLRWFVDYVRGMRGLHGRIYVRFAEPVALSEAVSVSTSLTGDGERAQVRKLAFEVSARIEHAKPITATDLVTLVLLAANERGLDEGQIREHAHEVVELIVRRELPCAGDVSHATGSSLGATLSALVETGLLERYDKGSEPVYTIAPGRQIAAAYYRNTIVNYFLTSALAELALAVSGAGTREDVYEQSLLALRDLFKFEFFFRTTGAFLDDARRFLDHRYPTWRTAMGSVFEATPPLFGHGVLRSFVDTYRILARVLLSHAGRPVAPADHDALRKTCLTHGEEMLVRRQIGTETALSAPLIDNAIRLAAHRDLLAGNARTLVTRREAFDAEILRVSDGINHLQERYDKDLSPDR